MTWCADNLTLNKHCFCGADGGVSKGFYQGLNVNTRSDDEPENVSLNLDIAAARVGLKKENLVLLVQGVSDVTAFVDQPSQDKIVADGLVTTYPNIGLCIRTADCAPVLLEDRIHGVIGAAHAGWRGAFKGIIENVVALMLEKGAKLESIAAAVGPCIGQESYEVDEGFYQQFVEKEKDFAQYFIKGFRKFHYLFDLESYCVDRLKVLGLDNIIASGQDTYQLKDKYYSFRRFTHLGLVQKPKCFPTELSVITL